MHINTLKYYIDKLVFIVYKDKRDFINEVTGKIREVNNRFTTFDINRTGRQIPINNMNILDVELIKTTITTTAYKHQT